jgi:hypothetical protein
MRVTIEIDEQARTASSVQTTTAPLQAAATDGGSPSAALMQGMAGDAPGMLEPVGMTAGTNAGPPPDWLVAAIAATPSPSTTAGNSPTNGAAIDAGAAPSLES